MKVRVKKAEGAAELDAVLRLRHRVFVDEEGYMEPRPDGLLLDRFDVLPETTQIVALIDSEVVGTARLTLDSAVGMPSDVFFDRRSDFPGASFASGSMLCVLREFRRPAVVFSLMAMTYYRAVDSGATHLFTAGNPEQRQHFERAGFRALGPEEMQSDKGLPFLPMALDLEALDDPFLNFIRMQNIESILTSFDRVFIGEGETLFRSGDDGDNAFVVVDGKLRVVIPRGDGDPVNVAEIGPGELVGELSLLTGQPRTATVEAATDCQLMLIGSDAFENACADRKIMRQLVHLLGSRLTSTLETVKKLPGD